MDISEILSSLTPEDINKLRDVASSFMGEQNSSSTAPPKDNVGFPTELLGAFGKMSADDDRTALIKALKPLLSEQRRQKADEAIKILRLLQLLPLLRESGMLNGLFQGEI